MRTKPERTYNPISDVPLPEGGHVPMVLARTYFEDKDRWKELKTALERFGRAAGLFEAIQIKPLGKHESDPFQIRVKIAGPASNLMDVGYGVSQVLPILVDSLLGEENQTFLLQQPEVHLHPRGQAELATFLAQASETNGHRFIVETHSDYLVDRLRMDIRDGLALDADDVSILFFERRKLGVAVHPLRINESGGLDGAPASFRKFFMEEERRFLSG